MKNALITLALLLLCAPAWAAISYIDSGLAGSNNGNDVTANFTALEDDIVICVGAIGMNTGTDLTMAMTTSGYTTVVDEFQNDTIDLNFGVFWKVMGATPDTTATLDGGGEATSGTAVVCMVFRGVDTTTPMDVTPTTAGGINTFIPDPPSINFVDANAWVVLAAGSGHSAATTTYTFPTGYPKPDALDDAGNDNADSTAGIGYNSSPSDPEDPGTLTPSTSDNSGFCWAAATLALRPQGAAAARRVMVVN